tara:strand:+ start:62 stop:661 length:600 start_codon:yes stop_codon:yes gene_type:complete
MARKRGRKRKSKPKKNSSIKNMAKGWVNKLAGPVVFWQQLSAKDYEVLNQSADYRSLDYLNKGKVAVNILIGALTGQRVFPEHYTPTPNGQPRINPTGFLNKWLGVAVLGKAYSRIGKQFGLPETASVNKISNKVAWGAIAGGIFDPPTSGGRVSTYNVLPNVSTQNISMRRNLNRQFESTVGYVSPDSFDPSTGSAFR